jgi:hypothetical protein
MLKVDIFSFGLVTLNEFLTTLFQESCDLRRTLMGGSQGFGCYSDLHLALPVIEASERNSDVQAYCRAAQAAPPSRAT